MNKILTIFIIFLVSITLVNADERCNFETFGGKKSVEVLIQQALQKVFIATLEKKGVALDLSTLKSSLTISDLVDDAFILTTSQISVTTKRGNVLSTKMQSQGQFRILTLTQRHDNEGIPINDLCVLRDWYPGVIKIFNVQYQVEVGALLTEAYHSKEI